jgi:hypothetical protein
LRVERIAAAARASVRVDDLDARTAWKLSGRAMVLGRLEGDLDRHAVGGGEVDGLETT